MTKIYISLSILIVPGPCTGITRRCSRLNLRWVGLRIELEINDFTQRKTPEKVVTVTGMTSVT